MKRSADDAQRIASTEGPTLRRVMAWYYEVDRQHHGPVPEEEFAALVAAGVVGPETLVWREGWPEWRTYGDGVAEEAGGGALRAELREDDPDAALCVMSGRRLPKTEMLEFEGKWVGVVHKAEFLQRLREGVRLPGEPMYASFGRRFGAKFIDGCIVGACVALLNTGLALVVIGSVRALGADSVVRLIAGPVLAQLVVIELAYTIYFVRRQDATPGKKMLGLRLLRANGARLSPGRVAGRCLGECASFAMLGIGYALAALDTKERRALHDRLADTRVLDARGV